MGALVVVVAAIAFVGFVRSSDEPFTIDLDELEPGGVTPVMIDDVPAFLVRTGGDIEAFRARSPHLAEVLVWCDEPPVFYSTFHGEMFDRYGNVLGGPAGEGMSPLPVERRGDTVEIDAGGPRRRGAPRPERPSGAVLPRAPIVESACVRPQ